MRWYLGIISYEVMKYWVLFNMQFRASMQKVIFHHWKMKPVLESWTSGLRAAWSWSAWKIEPVIYRLHFIMERKPQFTLVYNESLCTFPTGWIRYQCTTNADVIHCTCISQSKLKICLSRSADVSLLIHPLIMWSLQQIDQQHDFICARKWLAVFIQ